MALDAEGSGGEPAACDRSRLFDYFVVVSQTPSFLEETGADGDDNADLIKQCFWEPHLLDRYPLEDDTATSPLPDRDTLSQFLLPNCEQPIPLKDMAKQPGQPRFFGIVLTDDTGNRIYGSCLLRYALRGFVF
jgi:hypothetical protein